MNTTSVPINSIIVGLNAVRVQSNRYLTVATLIIGVVGNCLNVIVLSHPTLNKVPTTRYFIAASGASLASLCSGLVGRIASGWGADPASFNTNLCKFQAYTNKLGQTSCSYFILAAAIDRYLQSCPNIRYRHLSSIKNSTRAIFMILFILGIYHCAHAICYQSRLTIPPIKCYAGSTNCRYFENISYALVTVIIPYTIILFVGWKTISNIHHCRRNVGVHTMYYSANITNVSQLTIYSKSKPDSNRAKLRSLTRMLIVQVFLYIFLTLPAAAQSLYMTITLEDKGSVDTDVQLAIDRFLFAFTAILSYLALSLPFYLYTLAGTTFRQTIFTLIQKFKTWICCHKSS